MELLKQFPALWVVVGGILTGFMFWFLNRNVFSLTQSAQHQLSRTYKDQIEAITREKDYYRQKSEEYMKDLQAFKLRITELEGRPDLTSIFDTYRLEANKRFELYEEQSDVLRRLTGLIEQLATRFSNYEKMLDRIMPNG